MMSSSNDVTIDFAAAVAAPVAAVNLLPVAIPATLVGYGNGNGVAVFVGAGVAVGGAVVAAGEDVGDAYVAARASVMASVIRVASGVAAQEIAQEIQFFGALAADVDFAGRVEMNIGDLVGDYLLG